MKYTILLSLLLVGCGGGGGSTSSPTTQSAIITEPIGFFKELSNAITLDIPYSLSIPINSVPVDINNDGKDDLVVHIWDKPAIHGVVDLLPCKNTVKILIHQSDNSFKDETSTYIDGSNDLGGCSRKIEVVDVNADGKNDIIFAINQEDGRAQATPTHMDAQLAALVSTNGKYVVKKFGVQSWYHSVGVLYDNRGNALVAGNGYTGNNSQAFKFNSDASFSASSMALPTLSPNTFKFFSNTTKESTFMLQGSNLYQAYTDIDGYVKGLDGIWSRIPSQTLAPNVGSVNAIGWTGENAGVTPVFNLNGTNVTFAGISESCQIKLNPTSNPIILFVVGGAVVTNFVNGMTVKQNDMASFSNIVGATIVDRQIVKVNISINGLNNKFNYIECKDVNNDGYDDIISRTARDGGLPDVYLNDKNNGFNHIGTSQFPVVTDWSTHAFSILHDFDKDGVSDLIIFPECASTGLIKYKYFKGTKVLK